MTALVFGVDREPEGYQRPEIFRGVRMWCPWPPPAYAWSGPCFDRDDVLAYHLCPLPPQMCEWEGCDLPQDYEAGHHVYCTFHGEVWMHEAARDYDRDWAYTRSGGLSK